VHRLLAVEVDELLDREGISDEVAGGVLQTLLVFGRDRLAHVDGEAGLGDLSNAYFDGGTITGNQFNDIGCWGRHSVISSLAGVVYGTNNCQ